MPVVVRGLSDDVPGWIGLLPELGAVALVPFAEHDAALAPRDELGALGPWSADPAADLAFPGVTEGYTGPARLFDGSSGLIAEDAGAATLLTMNVTVQALVRWDAAAAGVGEAQTIAARGLGTDATERRCWEVRIHKVAEGTGGLEWAWQDRDGVEHVQPGGEFFAVEGFLLLTATREWARDRFLLRYWANDALLAEVESVDIEVGGGVGGHLTIGAARDEANYARHLTGAIDQLVVMREAVPTEQVSHVYQRLSRYQPAAYAALVALQPPGTARTFDYDSLVARHLRTRAAAVGAVAARAELSRAAGLPGQAYGERLAEWERIVALRPELGATIAERRERVIAALRGETGLTADALRATLAPLYGLDEAELELLLYDNLAIGTDGPAWQERGPGAVVLDAPSEAVSLVVLTGADFGTDGEGYAYRTSTGGEEADAADAVIAGELAHSEGAADVFLGFAALDGTRAGLLYEPLTGDIISTLNGSTVASSVNLPIKLAVSVRAGAVYGRINLGPESLLGNAPSLLHWAQAELVPTTSAPTGGAEVTFTGLIAQDRRSRQTQVGYVYGASCDDLDGARVQIARQKPAHALATAVTTRAVVCDDTDNGCDQAPVAETAYQVLSAVIGGDPEYAWIGQPVDLARGSTMTPAGNARYGIGAKPNAAPWGDQALIFEQVATDAWATDDASIADMDGTEAVAVIVAANVNVTTFPNTLLGKRDEAADLAGWELAVGSTGNLIATIDSGAAPVEVALGVLTAILGWHVWIVRYDPDASLWEVATQQESGSTTFPSSASSSVPLTIGVYRSADSPKWQCSLLAVVRGQLAANLDLPALASRLHALIAG